MKNLIAVLFLILGAPTDAPSGASAYGCGLKPIPPVGCRRDAVCVCNGDGECQWVFTKCR